MERVSTGLTHSSQQAGVTVCPRDPVDVGLHLPVHPHPARLSPRGERPPGSVATEAEVVGGSSLRLDGEVKVEGGGNLDGRVQVWQGDPPTQEDTD